MYFDIGSFIFSFLRDIKKTSRRKSEEYSMIHSCLYPFVLSGFCAVTHCRSWKKKYTTLIKVIFTQEKNIALVLVQLVPFLCCISGQEHSPGVL